METVVMHLSFRTSFNATYSGLYQRKEEMT